MDEAIVQFAPLVLIFVVFYFLLIRPQQKKAKEHQQMVNDVRRGDQVVAAGGIKGKIAKVSDDEIQLEIAEGVKIRIVKGTIQAVLGKGEPASE